MLSAVNKEQVRQWSRRQLGKQARLASVSERDYLETGLIEKEGTGITAREAEGCQPLMSIMANFIANVSDAKEIHMEKDAHVSERRQEGMKPTLH